ncbi:MAG: hypothetical protein JNM93_14265, partial [Bacteriovoracaceae bacterium]|nr:hypothetical protein [Bacteriovoracaceae bacterium]
MLRWLLIIFCVLSIRAHAQTSSSFTYGGRLANADGSPKTAAVTLTFEIANSAAAGVPLCAKSIPTTPDANGVFNVTVDFTLGECGGTSFAQ